MQNQRLTGILVAAGVLLCIPLVAMQFTNEVIWDGLDFVAAGILLFATGLTIEIVLRNLKGRNSRIIAFVVVLAFLFLVWAELSVGLFGTFFAGY